jgi:hypothetical protein
MTVYATDFLLYAPNAAPLGVREPGDRIDDVFTPEALEWLIAHDQATLTRPKDRRAVYSLVDISHRPGIIKRGTRIDNLFSQKKLREFIREEQASFDAPEEA